MFLLKDYWSQKYKAKVYKITIDAGFSCPNRDGTLSTGGCIYCDSNGSGNGSYQKGISIEEQIEKSKIFLRERYKASKFFLYYQAFSNTYGSVDRMKKCYDMGIKLNKGDIVGIIIGTRPDCINEEKLKLISSYYPEYEVWIEYGLQTIHNKSLEFINRKHSVDDYIYAVNLTKKYPIKITTHIIVGLPYESYDQIMETVHFIINHNKIDALKIHSLYITSHSKLEKISKSKKLKLMTQKEYVRTVADIIEILPRDLIIARLTGETDKNHLVSPMWVLDKQKVIRNIKEELKSRESYQGKYYQKIK